MWHDLIPSRYSGQPEPDQVAVDIASPIFLLNPKDVNLGEFANCKAHVRVDQFIRGGVFTPEECPEGRNRDTRGAIDVAPDVAQRRARPTTSFRLNVCSANCDNCGSAPLVDYTGSTPNGQSEKSQKRFNRARMHEAQEAERRSNQRSYRIADAARRRYEDELVARERESNRLRDYRNW
jgi:hypothetical protein